MNCHISYIIHTELLTSASAAQTTFWIQMIHLAFSSEHYMNILIWTFLQLSFWTMRESFLNVRANILGMFHECYRAHWVDMAINIWQASLLNFELSYPIYSYKLVFCGKITFTRNILSCESQRNALTAKLKCNNSLNILYIFVCFYVFSPFGAGNEWSYNYNCFIRKVAKSLVAPSRE